MFYIPGINRFVWQKLCVVGNIYSHKLWSNWYMQWHVLCDWVWQWSSYMSCHVWASSIQQNVIVCVCVCVCVLFVGVFSCLPSWGCLECGTTTSSVLKVTLSCRTIRWEWCTLLLSDIASEEWLIFFIFSAVFASFCCVLSTGTACQRWTCVCVYWTCILWLHFSSAFHLLSPLSFPLIFLMCRVTWSPMVRASAGLVLV